MSVDYQIINSLILLLFGIILWYQRQTIKTLETTIKAIDIDKIIKSKDIIIESKEEEYKTELRAEKKSLEEKIRKSYEDSNKDLVEKYTEMLSFLISVLDQNDEDSRKNLLQSLPKNKETISTFFVHYNAGKFSATGKIT